MAAAGLVLEMANNWAASGARPPAFSAAAMRWCISANFCAAASVVSGADIISGITVSNLSCKLLPDARETAKLKIRLVSR
jgi:hypothetical protein